MQFKTDYTAFVSFKGAIDQPTKITLAVEGIDGEEFDDKTLEFTYDSRESVTFKVSK